MADELAGISNISWVEEDALRLDVAARVAAQSSAEALQDEEAVRNTWKALEASEKRLAELQAALEEAERRLAGRANGLQAAVVNRQPPPLAERAPTAVPRGSSGPSGGVAAITATSEEGTPLSPAQHVGPLQFRVRAAEREVQKHLDALQNLQRDVERRRQERVRQARERVDEEAVAESAPPGPRSSSSSSSPPLPLHARGSGGGSNGGGAALRRALPGGSGPPPVRRGPLPVRGGGRTPPSSARHGESGEHPPHHWPRHVEEAYQGGVGNSFPPRTDGTVTMAEYSGGEVLPSWNRVQVTRKDMKVRHMRYDDDTDMEKFVARLAKRRRLEKIEVLQRHRLEHPEHYKRAVKEEEGDRPARVKRERSSEVAESTHTGRGRGVGRGHEETTDDARVKLEGDEDVSSPTLAKVQYEMDELSSPSFEDEVVIDVDALMEEEEDISLALLNRMLKRDPSAEGKGGEGGDSGGDTHGATGGRRKTKEGRTKRSRASSTRGRSGSGSDDDDDDDEDVDRLYSRLHLPPEPEVTLLPGIRIPASTYDKLLDYQQEGLRWLVHLHAQRCGGILGDEMGLGKTIQVAALLCALHHSQQLRGPALVVAPMTVLRQWVAELHRWAPHLRVCVMHESSNSSSGAGGSPATSRAALIDSVRATPAIVVTTYTALRLNCLQLQSGGFQYVILDEGHKISNPAAGVTLAAKSFTTPHRLILSGSPIQNRLKELWCLFDFVQPGLLGSMNRFVEEFEAPIARSRNIRATPVALASAVECAKVLQAQIAPYLLRRWKRQVNTILPMKFERVIRVPLSDEQLKLYVELVASSEVQRLISDTLYQPTLWGGRLNRDGRDSTGSLHVAGRRYNLMSGNQRGFNAGVRLEAFRVMNRLRHICNHVDLFTVVRGEDEDHFPIGLDVGDGVAASSRGGAVATKGRGRAQGLRGRASPTGATATRSRCFRSNNAVNLNGGSKLGVLREMMREWSTHGHRALLFTQTRMMLDIIENLVEQENHRYIRVDGTTPAAHRQELMDRFNEDDSITFALLTTRVGGIGVNLTGADRVVIVDPDWNPVTDVQARERAWRIGQTRDVCVYRLITSGTVEEAILRRQLSKAYVTDKVLKDPNLQRFFHQQDSLVESFFLGVEYDSRVPPGRKHVLAAQDVTPLPLADSAGGEQERALEEDDRAGPPKMTATTAKERGEGGEAARGGGGAAEKEFGQPLRVVRVDDDGFASVLDTDEEGSSPASPRGAGADAGCETELLKALLEGQDIALSGSDGAAQRLARSMAQQKMHRVTRHASERTLAQQNREFSLVLAAERQQAQEAADREEQRRFAEEAEDKALARQRQRRRE